MNRLSATPIFTPATPQVGRHTPVKFGNDDNKADQPAAPKPVQVIGQGQTLPPTPITIDQGVLRIIRKEESTANLKRDVWMVEDTTTGQKYSAFLDGTEEELVALYKELEKWGVGCKVKATGVASKPMSIQRFPFLILESIEKRP